MSIVKTIEGGKLICTNPSGHRDIYSESDLQEQIADLESEMPLFQEMIDAYKADIILIEQG